jgi:hypothetical protein
MIPQLGASLTVIIDDTSQDLKASANRTFTAHASLTIVNYNSKKIFIVQATGINE